MALSLSPWLSIWRYCHPFSLNAPPKPSHVCDAVPSLTVTVAFAVDVLMVPGVQVVPLPDTQLPLVEVYTAGPAGVVAPPVAGLPPAPVVPPAAAPPAPVEVVPPLGPPFPPVLAVVPPAAAPVEPPPALPPDPPVWLPPESPPELPIEAPPAPPFEVPLEPPLALSVAPPALVAVLPPEPPVCEGVVVPEEPQAANRTAIPTFVIDFRALFIALSSFTLGRPLASWPTACDMKRALLYSLSALSKRVFVWFCDSSSMGGWNGPRACRSWSRMLGVLGSAP